jgi:hypothetical protein
MCTLDYPSCYGDIIVSGYFYINFMKAYDVEEDSFALETLDAHDHKGSFSIAEASRSFLSQGIQEWSEFAVALPI